ncbi:hypothetical protein BDW67DRAFT_155000 [Aspergillus spinulosporus]
MLRACWPLRCRRKAQRQFSCGSGPTAQDIEQRPQNGRALKLGISICPGSNCQPFRSRVRLCLVHGPFQRNFARRSQLQKVTMPGMPLQARHWSRPYFSAFTLSVTGQLSFVQSGLAIASHLCWLCNEGFRLGANLLQARLRMYIVRVFPLNNET